MVAYIYFACFGFCFLYIQVRWLLILPSRRMLHEPVRSLRCAQSSREVSKADYRASGEGGRPTNEGQLASPNVHSGDFC